MNNTLLHDFVEETRNDFGGRNAPYIFGGLGFVAGSFLQFVLNSPRIEVGILGSVLGGLAGYAIGSAISNKRRPEIVDQSYEILFVKPLVQDEDGVYRASTPACDL